MRPVVRQQEVCSARFTCLIRNDLVNWMCTATAQRGAVCANGQASANYTIWNCVPCEIQERLRLKAFRLNKETTEEMTADILTKHCEWPKIEQHCATLNLRLPVKGLTR